MAKTDYKIRISPEDILTKSKRVEERINVTFRIKKSTVKDLKRICRDRDTTASSVVEVLIEQFLDGVKSNENP